MVELPILSEKFTQLAHKRGLVLGVLFGSQATGRTHPRSDVDVGFVADRELGLYDIAGLQEELMTSTGQADIEMVDLKNAPPLLLKKAAEEGILLYEREAGFFERFKIYGIKLYMEAQPLYQMQTASVKSFIQRHA